MRLVTKASDVILLFMPSSHRPETRPNILLITTDQQRYDAMGLNNPDSPLRTPNLDHLAATGVNFTRAYTTCPICIPARRSLLTGLHPTTHGLTWYQDGLEWEPPFTLPGLLSDAGYQTELLGKLHLFPQRKRYGFDHMVRSETPNHRPGSDHQHINDYADWLRDQSIPFHPQSLGTHGNGRVARPFHLDEEYHQTSWLADQAVRFLTNYRDPSCPFFLHLSFWAPHPPLIPPQAYWDRYKDMDYRAAISQWTPESEPIARLNRGLDPTSATGPFGIDEIRDAAAGYFGLINHVDDRISFVLDRFFEYGNPRAKEPTYIIFTSDHGEMLGDHHLWRKTVPYEGSAHVPFFISGVNVQRQWSTCDELVCLEDVVATALDLTGVEIPEALSGELESKSLAGVMRGETVRTRDRLFGQCKGYHYMIQGRYKYLWFAKTHEEQLFDLETDPQELCDLSGDTALLEPFRSQLAGHLGEVGGDAYDVSALAPCDNRPPRMLWPNG